MLEVARMGKRARRLCAVFCLSMLAHAGMAGSGQSLCRTEEFEAKGYFVCEIDVARDRLELRWRSPEGRALGSLGALVDGERAAGKSPDFAMNAGMYHSDLSPVGLHVEHKRELSPLATSGGFGNFYLKPNGVFYWGNGKAAVSETTRFEQERPEAEFATQSGPMLVIGGILHPRFLVGSNSLNIRNGVGVRDGSKAVFVLSRDAVTFHEFARFFRDQLGCPDALYLDGSISSLYAPSAGRTDLTQPLGPMLLGFRD